MLGNGLSIAMYMGVVIVSSLLLYIAQRTEEKNKNLFRVLSIAAVVILTIPVACRTCGVDLEGYGRLYDSAVENGWQNWLGTYRWKPEPLYALLNAAVAGLGLDFRWLMIICGAVSVPLLYGGLIRLRKYTNLGVCSLYMGCTMYMFLFGLNRIGLAVAIVSWSMKYFIEKNPVKYFVCIVIAIGFHYTALIMIPLYLIINCLEEIRLWKYSVMIIGLALLGLLIISGFRTAIVDMLCRLGSYGRYVNQEINIHVIVNEAIDFVLWVLIAIGCFQKQLQTREEIALSKLSVSSIAVIIAVLGTIVLHRLTYYIYPANALMYGLFANKFESGQIRIFNIKPKVLTALYYAGMIIMCILWIYNITVINTSWNSFLVPYTYL